MQIYMCNVFCILHACNSLYQADMCKDVEGAAKCLHILPGTAFEKEEPLLSQGALKDTYAKIRPHCKLEGMYAGVLHMPVRV